MYYTIYKTINLINGRYYIGKHKTSIIDDGYLGSGVLLKKAIQKYGKENFTKEILYVFQSEKEMNDKEHEMVSESVLTDKDSYNLRIGGVGGFSKEESLRGSRTAHSSGVFQTPEYKEKLSNALKGRVPHNKGVPMPETVRQKLSKLTRSDEFKMKVSDGVRNSEKCKGNTKPRFVYQIQCPDGTISSTTHLKNWCKSNKDLKGINDKRRMESRGYYILSKIKFKG